MLRLSLPSLEIFNEETQEFEELGGITIELEHSLYTVAKWEAVHKKIFSEQDTDFNFVMSYVKQMCMTEDVSDKTWLCLTTDQLTKIVNYMNDPHTATKIKRQNNSRRGGKQISSELIYYWMFNLQIPMECEHWHFNRLMTLIEVCSIESMPKKKMGKREVMQQQRELNAMRRAKYGTKG